MGDFVKDKMKMDVDGDANLDKTRPGDRKMARKETEKWDSLGVYIPSLVIPANIT